MKHSSIAVFAIAALLPIATPSFAMEPVKRVCVQASDAVERCEYLTSDGREVKPSVGPWNDSYNATTQTVCADEGGSAYKPITRSVIMCGPIADFKNGDAPAISPKPLTEVVKQPTGVSVSSATVTVIEVK